MRKTSLALLTVALTFPFLAAQPDPLEDAPEVIEIDIQVSPQTILLDWRAKGDVKVTIHADVSFHLFSGPAQVELDGVSAYAIKADNRGDMVAKFDFDEIASRVEPGTATLTLEAIDDGGTAYFGSDEVRVVEGS